MVDEIKFPLDFKECPVCGSTRRIAGEVLEMQKEKGNIGLESNAYLFPHQSVIADAKRTFLSAPMILTFYDACADCGTVYCIHADVKVVVPGGKLPPPTFSPS